MKQTTEGWWRVDRNNPCPICGNSDWCGLSPGKDFACCMRIHQGALKETLNGGFLHRLRRDILPVLYRIRQKEKVIIRPEIDFTELNKSLQADKKMLEYHGYKLGLNPEALAKLEMGWSTKYMGCTFPMRNGAGEIVGLRIRTPNGTKFAWPGGKEGVFKPITPERANEVFVCEGPTDTAALISVGLYAIGRPSNIGGLSVLPNSIKACRPKIITLLLDRDSKPLAMAATERGKERLINALGDTLIRVMRPPEGIKDVRQWINDGAEAAEIQCMAKQSPILGKEYIP